MSRERRKFKLRSAIIDWRGTKDSRTGRWIQPPKQAALARIIHWLAKLGRTEEQAAEDIKEISRFKVRSEMENWIAGLYDKLSHTAPTTT